MSISNYQNKYVISSDKTCATYGQSFDSIRLFRMIFRQETDPADNVLDKMFLGQQPGKFNECQVPTLLNLAKDFEPKSTPAETGYTHFIVFPTTMNVGDQGEKTSDEVLGQKRQGRVVAMLFFS